MYYIKFKNSNLRIGIIFHNVHIVSLKKKYQTTIGFTVFIFNINITNIVSSHELIKPLNIKIYKLLKNNTLLI